MALLLLANSVLSWDSWGYAIFLLLQLAGYTLPLVGRQVPAVGALRVTKLATALLMLNLSAPCSACCSSCPTAKATSGRRHLRRAAAAATTAPASPDNPDDDDANPIIPPINEGAPTKAITISSPCEELPQILITPANSIAPVRLIP